MTIAEEMAVWVSRTRFDDLDKEMREALKIRVLDSLGCAYGALDGEPILMLRRHVDEFGGASRCTLIGGGNSAPDRAALLNSALVRYLDFNDSFLASGETCHPSDTLGAVLAAAEYAAIDGTELLTALAVAYQVQCRLSEMTPVRAKGFDHTTQGAVGVAAGVARALRLDQRQTAHALAIAATQAPALRVTRTGALSHWKGMAFAHTAFASVNAAFLAKQGITGPLEVFEGKKGWGEAFGGSITVTWAEEGLDLASRTIMKKYNAEIHGQSAIDAALTIKRHYDPRPEKIDRIEVDTFDVAFHIIGGGDEGSKVDVQTKEEADHSLPYLVAVALLDGQVMPEQYRAARIGRADVQGLLRKVVVSPRESYSRRFPEAMPCRVRIHFNDGRQVEQEQEAYEGFVTQPMSWETVCEKFEDLSRGRLESRQQRGLVELVGHLEERPTSELMELLGLPVESGRG